MNIKKKLGILLIVIVAVSGLIGYYRVSYAGNLETVTEGNVTSPYDLTGK